MSSNSPRVSKRLLGMLKDPGLLALPKETRFGPAAAAHRGNNKKNLMTVMDPSLACEESTDSPLAYLHEDDVDTASKAVEVAVEASSKWKRTLGKERSKILKKAADFQREYANDLATILSVESGKPMAESLVEIESGASFYEWFAEEAKRLDGFVTTSQFRDRETLVTRRSLGVAALLTPYNFPNSMLARKLGACLAAGCTAVVRPSEYTPLSTLATAQVFERAGLPEHVLNVLTSTKATANDISKMFCENDKVKAISFTGSTAVGKRLAEMGAKTLTKMSLELGGNAPFIVFDDADIDKAVEAGVQSKFRHSGQTCICANRFLVQAGVFEEFTSKFVSKVKGLKIGKALDKDVKISCLMHRHAVEKVESLVNEDVGKGAKVLCGGKRLPEHGELYYAPTVLTNVSRDSKSFCSEIFGPVAPMFKFATEAEALEMANDTEFGLASYLFTSDLGRALRFHRELQFGMICVNASTVGGESAPFGGVKDSGYGREGSRLGVDEFTEWVQTSIAFGG